MWLMRWLPQGRALPRAAWVQRHRVVVSIALVQAAVLGVVSALWGPAPSFAPLHVAIVALPALLAIPGRLPRTVRSSLATTSLMAASMMLVYLWSGQTEAHFHFFVMVALVALYQDWAPFGTALFLVLAHHGILGTVLPHDVFGHHHAYMHPWLWAGVHAAFVLAASVTSLAAWRLNEQIVLRDAVTGLASRTMFHELATAASRRSAPFGVVFVDLDDFKNVNDTHGHDVGDHLLTAVGGRLAGALRASDTLARLGGDEFAAIVHGSALQVEMAANRMLASLDTPIEVDGLRLRVAASIGVAARGETRTLQPVARVLAGDRVAAGTTKVVAGLLRDADVAMYAAKDGGKHRVVAYTDGMTDSVRRRSNLQQDLKQAVDDGQVGVAYQPIVDMGAEQVTGYEALARWHHPTAGTISPAEFIDWAEADGTIVALGAFVLDRAVENAARWSRDLDRPVQMAVNVSPTQLTSPGWVASVTEVLDRHGLPAGQLTLEITENVVAIDAERAIEVLAELRDRGVRIAIDDFGTGFSNLAYLRRLPCDVIKIDRSFVADIDSDPTTATLVSSMIQLAASMDLDVVAEGVETTGQRRTLALMGCSRAQGFLFARPQPSPQHQLVTQVADAGGVVPARASHPQVAAASGDVASPAHPVDDGPTGVHRLSHYLAGPTGGVRARCSCGYLTTQTAKRSDAHEQLAALHGLTVVASNAGSVGLSS
ncbi:putative bifunctional diguanylate cyclase/phosphodiesterase [Solicola sp. PLA-1-18]|uniref:putative bifunctional diguanylate cyclase/phosphodiesterase n=1 Tax=Solicola sp. PLA-1-18 TaxID=3380532 RepID=UPI003B818E75